MRERARAFLRRSGAGMIFSSRAFWIKRLNVSLPNEMFAAVIPLASHDGFVSMSSIEGERPRGGAFRGCLLTALPQHRGRLLAALGSGPLPAMTQ